MDRLPGEDRCSGKETSGGEDAHGAEPLLYAQVGVFVRAEKGVAVEPVGQKGEGTGGFFEGGDDIFLDVMAAGKIQLSDELPVDGMLHDHILHGAAFVNDSAELRPGGGSFVPAGDPAHQTAGGPCETVSAGGRCDLMAGSPEQGNIAHDDLTAHGEIRRERGGAQGLVRLFQFCQNGVSSLFGVHGGPPFLQKFPAARTGGCRLIISRPGPEIHVRTVLFDASFCIQEYRGCSISHRFRCAETTVRVL